MLPFAETVMKYLFFFIAFFFLCEFVIAQGHGFSYGQATYRELDMKVYEPDTSAVALILDEFGEAYFEDGNDYNLLFEYHARIKILKKGGVAYGTFEIPLRKIEGRTEKIVSIKASAFNIENGSMRETKLDPKNVFSENQSKYSDAKKFAIPNVKEGSVIEVFYVLASPFLYKFRPWEFQSDIPKLQSEFWALIPGNYLYNVSLRGFLKLTKNESELVKSCFMTADCSRLKYGIKNIPAFNEEEFMTAKSNFISAVNFELSQINYFDGRKDKITKEWKDADEELRQDSKFGVQIKRGKDIVDSHIDQLVGGETDPLAKAKKIYDFIKGWYKWNDSYGEYSEFGIKKSFESKTGNVGDINLSLIAALRYAEVPVEPMLLSTRQNGLVTDLYPVLSEFNYVVAKVTIAGKTYLLDATDDFHPFGLLPERCLNGNGRVIGDKESYWLELKPTDREKTTTILNLTLDDGGVIKGSIQYLYAGYKAVNERKKIYGFSSLPAFINDYKSKNQDLNIGDFEIENADDLTKPLIFRMTVAFGEGMFTGDNFLFNPFITEQWQRNPFKSSERLYPIDFGAPLEEIMILTLDYPPGYEIDGLPGKVGLALPQNGGRFIFEIQNSMNKLSVNNSLLIAKPVFSSHEYHYLKELFNNVLAVQRTELVFKKKK
jgi:transglutaminase-like putative cysteine protease